MSNLVDILGMDKAELEEFFTSLGQPKFRAGQIINWVHTKRVLDFDLMSDFNKVFRSKLKEISRLEMPLKVVSDSISKDGTRKWLFSLSTGDVIETVCIPEGKRKTLCISSQAGCALNCSFCHTGKQGFSKNLSASEIIAQLWYANHMLNQDGEGSITNVVMMGMGEPLLNLSNVVSSLRLMVDDKAYGLSKRRVTVSTSGVVPGILQLAKETDVALALSLHASNDQVRSEIIPLNKKYPIDVLMKTLKEYLSHYKQEKHITIEYVMLDGVNDKIEHARELAKLLRDIPVKINLIPFNPFEFAEYKCSDEATIKRFSQVLLKSGYIVTVRKTRGDDISGACGQLAGEIKDRTRRKATFEAKYQKLNIIKNNGDGFESQTTGGSVSTD